MNAMARRLDPIISGWINYYGRFRRSELHAVSNHIHFALVRWVIRKFKRFARCRTQAYAWLWGGRASESDAVRPLAVSGLDDKSGMSREAHVGFCEHPGVTRPLVESFFHSLKVESVHGVPLMHPDALRQALFETIEVECNRTRRHSAPGYVSPDVFEARILA